MRLQGAERLPTLDEAFLRALYSDKVLPGMSSDQSIAVIVDEISNN